MRMKYVCYYLITIGSFTSFGQTTNQEPVADSTLKVIDDFSKQYAAMMENWSPEKIKKFNDIFRYRRGHINIPTEPVRWEE